MSATRDPAPDVLPRSPPSGTVTFAFTDVEGSTVRWERYPRAMGDALRRHDALMRSAIIDRGGHVFKTIGDAFCAAFVRPHEAVAAMLDAQRALTAQDFALVDGIRVRAAIHTGATDERDGDYFGPPVNRVARLLAIAHGGQVLISGVTSELVRGSLSPNVSLRDLGEHRLKDLAWPEHVYQLLAPDLRTDFPALRALGASPNNLPAHLTALVGRETEIAEIEGLVQTHRLVSIVGSGGIGKTRTSLQVAANLLDESVDGVWFVELAPLANGDYVPTTVASALGIGLASEGDATANLARALKEKRALLVLDNCEHLVESVARVVSVLLHACPMVKILASTRQVLGVAGEITYRLPSLGVPSESQATRLRSGDVTLYSATALFAERARAADRRFTLNDENAPMVGEICRRLDGIPLAIELASARVNVLGLRQLRDGLDERFLVLTGGRRDVLPRQKTLRALIDWSHDLLAERERSFFRRLGIFANGCTFEGAIAIGTSFGLDELDAFDVLASLVDKSLVSADPDGDALRYRLLGSTRAYALGKLDSHGERDALANVHARYLWSRFTELWSERNRTGRSGDLYSALKVELEDVRSALEFCIRADVNLGAEMLASIDREWAMLGLENEGVVLCERYLASLASDESRLLARLGTILAFFLDASGRKARARRIGSEAVVHARASGDSLTLIMALIHIVDGATIAGRVDDAHAALLEAEGIPTTSARMRVGLIAARARLAWLSGDLELAARMHERLRTDHRALANERFEFVASLNLAEIEHERGRTWRAIEITREILPVARGGTDKNGRANVLFNSAGYLVAADDLAGAASAAREVVEMFREQEPDHVYTVIALQHLALVFALRDDFTRAATIEGYVDAALAKREYEREYTERTTHARLTVLIDRRLSSTEREHLFAQGAALAPESAMTLALHPP